MWIPSHSIIKNSECWIWCYILLVVKTMISLSPDLLSFCLTLMTESVLMCWVHRSSMQPAGLVSRPFDLPEKKRKRMWLSVIAIVIIRWFKIFMHGIYAESFQFLYLWNTNEVPSEGRGVFPLIPSVWAELSPSDTEYMTLHDCLSQHSACHWCCFTGELSPNHQQKWILLSWR